jgi:hypothetical protein
LLTGSGASTGTQDGYLVKYDSLGNFLWLKQIGVAAYQTNFYGISTDAQGNSYVSAASSGNLQSGSGAGIGGGGDFDADYLKFDSTGNRVWVLPLGVSGQSTQAYGVVYNTATDSVFVSGYTTGNLSTGSGASVGMVDTFIAKYDSNANKQWLTQVGVTGSSVNTYALAVDTAGLNAYTSGYTNTNVAAGSGASIGAYDGLLMKFNSSGVRQWSEQLGVAGHSFTVLGATIDPAGTGIYLSGYSDGNQQVGSGASIGSDDSIIAKYDSSGNKQWVRDLGVTSATTRGNCLAMDFVGDPLIGGSTTGNLEVGSGPSVGTADGFLVEYSTLGVRF